jgi:hypothetical protein
LIVERLAAVVLAIENFFKNLSTML